MRYLEGSPNFVKEGTIKEPRVPPDSPLKAKSKVISVSELKIMDDAEVPPMETFHKTNHYTRKA